MTYVEKAREYRKKIETVVEYTPDDIAFLLPELFPQWNSNNVQYIVGHRVQFNGLLYKCLQNHTSQENWNPILTSSLWVKVSNPEEEWPLIPNPIISTNPWMNGQKGSMIDGSKWISKIDNNVWQPNIYPAGWEAIK